MASEDWQGNYNKFLESHKNCECYGSKKIQETNIVFSNWYFSPCFQLNYFSFFVFLRFLCVNIFQSHFWLSLDQKSGRAHISITYLWHQGKIKIKCHTEISEKLLNLELYRSHAFYLWHTRYSLFHLGTRYSRKNSNFSIVILTDLISCNYRLPKTNRSYMCIFSIGLYFFSNALKMNLPSFNCLV